MTTNKGTMRKRLFILSALIAVTCSAWLGYVAGQKRPLIVKREIGRYGWATGWDSTNRCVAIWEWTPTGSSYTGIKGK